MIKKQRCKWCTQDKIYIDYHDKEWGKPAHDENKLFELLILEGAQAGLSWLTVLKKRENYRKAFDNFNPKKVTTYNEKKVQELLTNEGIIRNQHKIRSAIRNAKVFLEIQQEFGSFDNYIWQFVNNKPIKNHFKDASELPTKTILSDKISKDLQKRGMNFVGSTIIYAYMQAIGMVNDHTQDCFLYKK
ncbi:DNA-3-methyladenine glycosylase I [Candidatus Woesearchaeota archaeon]|nr:DNA-3-methyladenine glycosylase I [Candidatus Woesearchaeota archaeon]